MSILNKIYIPATVLAGFAATGCIAYFTLSPPAAQSDLTDRIGALIAGDPAAQNSCAGQGVAFDFKASGQIVTNPYAPQESPYQIVVIDNPRVFTNDPDKQCQTALRTIFPPAPEDLLAPDLRGLATAGIDYDKMVGLKGYSGIELTVSPDGKSARRNAMIPTPLAASKGPKV